MECGKELDIKQLSSVCDDLAETRAESRRIIKQLNDVCINKHPSRFGSRASACKSKDIEGRLEGLDIKDKNIQRNQKLLIDSLKIFTETLDIYIDNTAGSNTSGRLSVGNSEDNSLEIVLQTIR